MKQPRILDCTLRDGGYYNNWDFSLDFGKNMVSALVEAGVDVIEMGYRSLPQKDYCGPFKYSPESALEYLKDYPEVDFAFMIDIKEYVTNNALDIKLLDSAVRNRDESVFSMVRIASYFNTLQPAIDAIDYFNGKGYKVCFNLMGSAMLSREQMVTALQLAADKPLEAFYIADSFGSMYPDEVRDLIKFFRANYSGNIGLHLHENQGMAYANALAALEEGIDYIDATITGMGRGAGNLVMEQFLQGYAHATKNEKVKPHALLEFIAEYVAPIKNIYQWGFNYVYMLSGLQNIHPTYCQALLEGNRYTFSQITAILNTIPVANKGKYDEKMLAEAVKTVLQKDSKGEAGEVALEPFLNKKQPKAVLIVAAGPTAAEHAEGLRYLIDQYSPLVLECNNTEYLKDVEQRVTILLNKVKLHHYVHTASGKHNTIVTGQKSVEDFKAVNNIYSYPFTIGKYAKGEMQIPDYDAGMYAIALAESLGAEEILLAGFDGFNDESKNAHMQQFFDAYGAATGKKLKVLTPTKYNSSALSKQSLYSTIL